MSDTSTSPASPHLAFQESPDCPNRSAAPTTTQSSQPTHSITTKSHEHRQTLKRSSNKMTKSERNKAIETRDARIEILGQGIEAHLGKIKAYIERNESDWEMWDKKWEAVRERRETVGWKLRPSDEQDDGEGSRCGEDKREG